MLIYGSDRTKDLTLEDAYKLNEKYGLVVNVNDGKANVCIED